MSRRRQDDTTVGEDAFLDIVANLVGILIILVFLVCTGTKTAAISLSKEQVVAAEKQLDEPINSAKNIERDLVRQREQLASHLLEVEYRSVEREAILQKLLATKEMIDEKKKGLDDEQIEELEEQRKLNEMERRLAELIQQHVGSTSSEKPVVVLQHLPTPMAKTVFGKEIHVMIRGGRIIVIPWDMLVSTLKEEAQRAISRATRRDRITEQMGPLNGFMMQYSLISKRGLVSNGSSTAMAHMIELDKFELEPTNEAIRETLDEALSENGRLRVEMATYQSRETTITAWVYPDSFETFRQLKERVFQEGFMAAARPLPDGIRIGASPRGAQTTAQ
jgi:hypothetical protein